MGNCSFSNQKTKDKCEKNSICIKKFTWVFRFTPSCIMIFHSISLSFQKKFKKIFTKKLPHKLQGKIKRKKIQNRFRTDIHYYNYILSFQLKTTYPDQKKMISDHTMLIKPKKGYSPTCCKR